MENVISETENMINLGNGAYARREIITPELAGNFAASKFLNRSFSRPRSFRYSDSLIDNKWCQNGSTIVIDWDGNMIDGQHRVDAILRTGIAMDTMVVRGVDPEVAKTIDTGKSRTDADLLTMLGYKYGNDFATAIKIASLHTDERPTGKQGWSLRDNLKKGESIDEYLERIEFPYLFDCVTHSAKTKSRENSTVIGPAKAAVAQHIISDMMGEDIGDAFVLKIYSSYGLKKGDPVLAFQQAMYYHKLKKMQSTSNGDDFRMLIKTWNHFVSGKVMKNILTVKGIDGLYKFNKVSPNIALYVDKDGILQRKTV